MEDNGGSAPQAVKCIGVGRLFGHKFQTLLTGERNATGSLAYIKMCKRCGYVPT